MELSPLGKSQQEKTHPPPPILKVSVSSVCNDLMITGAQRGWAGPFVQPWDLYLLHAALARACTFISARQRRKGESDIWLESPKTHTPPIHSHSGESAGLSCGNTAACDQSIDRRIDGHDNGRPQPAGPSIPPPEGETDGPQEPVRRQQAEKVFQTLGFAMRKLWLHPSNGSLLSNALTHSQSV